VAAALRPAERSDWIRRSAVSDPVGQSGNNLRHQGELFASVVSDTTVWRALEEITPARLGKITVA
jgi:hypothetical protein